MKDVIINRKIKANGRLRINNFIFSNIHAIHVCTITYQRVEFDRISLHKADFVLSDK